MSLVLADERPALTHTFRIGPSFEGVITVGFTDDGQIAEVFVSHRETQDDPCVKISEGMLQAFAMMLSRALRAGDDVEGIIRTLEGQCFEPAGRTNHPAIPYTSSFVDYLGRYLRLLHGRVALPQTGGELC